MNYFTASTLEAMSQLDDFDVAYCKKLAKHFENLGISQETGSKAIQHLAEEDAVPVFISKAGFPSFHFPFSKKSKKSEALELDLQESLN